MSAPLGYNAGTLLGMVPWKTFRRTPAITVTTAATPIPTTPLANRKGIWIWNVGTTNCFIGLSSDLSTSNEPTLYVAQSQIIPATDELTVYARVASGTALLLAWEYA